MVTKELLIKTSVVIVCFVAGVILAYFYQPQSKSMQIYSQALNDYEQGRYQNAYYLFSKISFSSKLKPYAIFRQSMCANKLGDKKAEKKQYQMLFNNYTKNRLSLRAKYLTAQMLVDENPELAKKYFEEILEKHPNSDYAIASEYYNGLLLMKKYKNTNIIPKSDKNKIEMAFRHYLEKAPQGRLALNAANYWQTLGTEILSDDYLLMAKTYYLFEDYEKAKELIAKVRLEEGWVLDVKNSYALKNYARIKKLIPYGLKNYMAYANASEIKDVVDIYIKISDSKKSAIDYLYQNSAAKGKDYVWSLKCNAAPKEYQLGCYKELYANYPNGSYGANALSNIFFDRIIANDYKNAEKIGNDYINKFPKEKTAPMVKYWLAKISERKNNYELSSMKYKEIIAEYPDDYYAYRAYLSLKQSKATLLNTSIKPQPIEYPYKTGDDRIIQLAELGDYELIDLITDDEFIKSWVYYKKGEISHSMLIAREAMEKLETKPDRNDPRWRLVYPVYYYDTIIKSSNHPQLILALIREESYFNPNAVSSVGARGLMQLMPATAEDFGVNADELFNPGINIRTGISYYIKLRNMLNGKDISAIASYNGGIGSIKKWQTSIVYNDTDEFIEQIPYAETKNYVKKVFRSYWNYTRIYTAAN